MRSFGGYSCKTFRPACEHTAEFIFHELIYSEIVIQPVVPPTVLLVPLIVDKRQVFSF